MMKRPTWVTIVGILGVIFSGFGMLGAVQEIGMPRMMEAQKEIFTQMEEDIHRELEREKARRIQDDDEARSHEGGAGDPIEFPMKILEFFKNIWDVPGWYGTWSVISGIVKLFVGGFFLFASISLLQVRPSSIRLFYWAAGLSITLAIVKGLVAFAAIDSFLGVFLIVGGLFGIVIDTVLIVVTATGDKEAFHRKLPPPLPENM